ncbi:hypothetical protein [Aureliella helgolandensis]|uniref:Uncharacterized protein n=1 Tax=Aureliella helgolandensis TaxID=2527968 RepID=A0A518GGM1_9BACT|nr:hypothetical protein [Aureliella helgolandensis]QDV27723.1 hypothetical protein Q31a_61160 [Aureliella helgolandensis]
MAKCDEGYLCEVCGEEVEGLADSALYLQYVIGWIDPETLHTRRECHLRCHPTLAQFIDDSRFTPPVQVEGDFDRRLMDVHFAAERVDLVTRGYQRLCDLGSGRQQTTVVDYPLPEAQARWR